MGNEQTTSKYNLSNETKIRQYCKLLAQKKADSTVLSYEKSIEKFQKFFKYEDFRKFNRTVSVDYVEYLRRKYSTLNTINTHLRNLRSFLEWLCNEISYKSKINYNDIQYLTLKDSELRSINTSAAVDYPTFEQAKALFNSIEVKNEIDKRDKVLIAFMVATGMRVEALTTLTIQAVDINKMLVMQARKYGVNTKFGKNITTKIFNHCDEMTQAVVEWIKFLKEEKLFGNSSPVFPQSKQTQDKIHTAFVYNDIDNMRWESTNPVNKILKNRAKAAGLPEFSPHKFRHLSIYLTLQKCRNGEEIKAVTQNFGHEDVRTALQTYGNLSKTRLVEVLDSIDKNSDNTLSKGDIMALAELVRTLNKESK